MSNKSKREKSVTIPESFFVGLSMFVLSESYRTDEHQKELEKEITAKLDRDIEHKLYSKSFTAPTAEERKQARIDYLKKKGIPPEFWW